MCMGQRASWFRASPKISYHLCGDADESGLPNRCLLCSQPVPRIHQRRSIIHFWLACQQSADWRIFILAHQCLLMFIFNYKQEHNNGRIIKKKKRKKTSELNSNSFKHFASIHLESIIRKRKCTNVGCVPSVFAYISNKA